MNYNFYFVDINYVYSKITSSVLIQNCIKMDYFKSGT